MSFKSFTAGITLGLGLVAASTFAIAGKVSIADQGSDTVTVIDVVLFKKLAIIPVGRSPHNVQVAPDAKRLWVTNNSRPSASEQHQKQPAWRPAQLRSSRSFAVIGNSTSASRWVDARPFKRCAAISDTSENAHPRPHDAAKDCAKPTWSASGKDAANISAR